MAGLAQAVVSVANLGPTFGLGTTTPGKIDIILPVQKYQMMKAINANATTGTGAGGGGGVDAMLAFIPSPNFGNAAFLAFHMAPWEVAAGDFENLVLVTWLSGSTSASPPGLGLSTTSSPTLANVLAALRTSAASQTS